MSTMTLSPAPQVRVTGQLRLTRRGRIVVFVATMLLVMGAALFLGNASMATNHSGTDQPTHAVVVEPGDTLWGIAGDLADDGEVREMVHTIKELNALDSSVLMTGQTIYVPAD